MEINFSHIRTHDGSKNSGLEELICQIAHLQKPDNGKRFVKKDGAGGDAGVECYWILEDDSEICWQAKYFLEGMNSSRWQQIDESFATALEKHPKLAHYIVCLPLDKADSRKKGKGGRQVTSVEDEGITDLGILLKDGTFHHLSMNYRNNINKMYEAVKSVNPNVSFPKKTNKRVEHGPFKKDYDD